MVCLAPRVASEIVRPRRLSGVVVRPLNFTVRPHMHQPWRIWLAFAVAPTVASAVGAALLAPLMQGHLTLEAASWNTKLMLAIAAIATVVLAIPTFLFLRRRRRIRIAHCLAAGLLIGILGGGLIGAVVGLLAGFFFWVIGIWRNGEDSQHVSAGAV